MLENWSPPGWFEEATFERVSKSFENPDWVPVTLHSYRSRWEEAEPDPASVWLETKIKQTKSLSVPTVFFQGEKDGVNQPKTSETLDAKFTGPFARIMLPGVGHFPTREAPDQVARHLVAHFSPRSSQMSDVAPPFF